MSNKANPWIRDIYSGLLQMAASASKSPALLYAVNQLHPTNIVASKLHPEVMRAPKALYENKLTTFLSEATNNQSYVNERWHSKGDTLVSVIKRKDPIEISEYLAHNILSNAPQQLALVISTLSGFGTPALLGLASMSASDSYSNAIKKGADPTKATINAIINGTAEAAFERLGTVGVTKSLKKTLTKQLGEEIAKKTIKNSIKKSMLLSLKAGGQEGLEEALTSVTQDVSAHLTDVQKTDLKTVIGNAFESATIGALSGSLITAPTTAMSVAMDDAVQRKKMQGIKDTVERQGGTNIKIQKGFIKKDGTLKPDMILFDEPNGSTLAIKETDFHPYLVRRKLKKYQNPISYLASTTKGLNVDAINKDFEAGMPYLKGNVDTQYSRQKKIVFDRLNVDIDKFQKALGSKERYAEFIKLHEDAHRRYGDRSYDDAFHPIALSIEERANKYAFDKLGIDPKTIQKDFDTMKLEWHSMHDINEFESRDTAISLQQLIMKKLGKQKYDDETKKYDKAIHRHIDLKNNPSILKKSAYETVGKYLTDLNKRRIEQGEAPFNVKQVLDANFDMYRGKSVFDVLPQEEKDLYQLAENLPDQMKEIAQYVEEEYKAKGKQALNEGIINNMRDNYTQRKYAATNDVGKWFEQSTLYSKRSLDRIFDTMPEAFILGYNLARDGATTNLLDYSNDINTRIADRWFVRSLANLDNGTFLTTKARRGYKLIDHPTFVNSDGSPLFAPEKAAKIINNIFQESKLKNKPVWQSAVKLNALLKAYKLTSSLFHHIAFANSYIFGTNKNFNVKDWNPLTAWKDGQAAIEDGDPLLKLLVSQGLTLGRIQDWDEQSLRQKTALGKFLDKNKVTKEVKDKIVKFREDYTNFLFQQYGAGLKAKSAMITFRNHMERNPDMSPELAAREVAKLVNDNYGGLHHQRMNRNQTLQDILRFSFLGADWTESNIRTMIKAIKSGTETETELYRRFWAGAASKYAIGWLLFNLLGGALTRDDDEEKNILQKAVGNYTQAWEDGKLNHMRVALNPYLDFLGIPHKDRYYHNIWGQFLDPVKWFTRGIKKGGTFTEGLMQLIEPSRLTTGLMKSAYYKSAQVPQAALNALLGTDYTFYRRYNTLPKLIKTGKVKDWRKRGEQMSPIKASEIPSYLIHESGRIIPIPIMNLFHYIFGEIEGIEAVMTTLGQDVKQAYSKEWKKHLKSIGK